MLIITTILEFFLMFFYVLQLSQYQVGPNCGFQCMVYIAQHYKIFNRKKKVYQSVKRQTQKNRSLTGEIFDINNFLCIANEEFPYIKWEKRNFHQLSDLEELISDYYIIFPTLINETPHFVTIVSSNKTDFICKPRCDVYHKNGWTKKTNQLQYNKQISNHFDWNKFFTDSKKSKMRALIDIFNLHQFRLFLLNKKLEKKYSAHFAIHPYEQNVNLIGQIIIAPKIKMGRIIACINSVFNCFKCSIFYLPILFVLVFFVDKPLIL